MNKKIVTKIVVILLFILAAILSLKFDSEIMKFLSQYETAQTLLNYSDFWNKKLHDWQGDMLTLVGVMLALTLPFIAQVVQWVVTAYGVNSFPEIIKSELKIHRLLIEMFIFVGTVIFWRLFIYEISPDTQSFYILFNAVIAIYFIYILVKLFRVINYILQCTFNFQGFVIDKAYKLIKNTTDSIPTPFSEITDISIIPELTEDYLQKIELLRDFEMSEFERGNIYYKSEGKTFDTYIWLYIRALLSTNDLKQLKEAVKLQKNLSPSIVRMCVFFHNEDYNRYIQLANSLAYRSYIIRYYTLDEKLEPAQEGESDLPTKRLNDINKKEYSPFNDMIFLADNLESKP